MNDLPEKREQMRRVVLKALKTGKAKNDSFSAIRRKISLEELFEEETKSAFEGWPVSKYFDIKQGVTWGGLKCEDIYVVDKKAASSLESKCVFRTIGGKDIDANKINWGQKYLVFPYIGAKSRWIPAFKHPNLGGDDALDFSRQLSRYERGKDVHDILEYRIAKDLVDFPKLASYLVEHYTKLEQREFEEKKMSEYGKSWYEYHRPRTPRLITRRKIVGRRLMKTPAFALDRTGYLPRDSVISLIPKRNFEELRKRFEKALRHKVTKNQMLSFTLAMLNSEMFQELLKRKRSKKRGGYHMIGERLLNRFFLPRPNQENSREIERVFQGQIEDLDVKEIYKACEKRTRS